MNTDELRRIRMDFETAGIEFVREDETGIGPRFGEILARSWENKNWIAIGQQSVDPDTLNLLQRVLESVARGDI